MTDVRVLLRPPLWGRLWMISAGIAWCSVVIVFTVRDKDFDPLTILTRLFGILFVFTLVHRSTSEELWLEGEQLVVRNFMRTRRLRRQDIKRIWMGLPVTAPWPGGWARPFGAALNIDLTEGKTLTVDISHYVLGVRAQERVEKAHTEVNQWLQQR